MDYEKKYKHALDLAKQVHDTTISKQQKENIETIFPELAESKDEKVRKWLYSYFRSLFPTWIHPDITCEEILDWLEKQGASYTKRDVDDAYVEGMASAKNELEKQKSSWSEDDEKMKDLIISVLEVNYSKGIFKVGLRAIRTEEIVSWLKSLKEKYIWKPSGEQMVALHDMNLTGNISYAGQGQVLIELYNDLKKL